MNQVATIAPRLPMPASVDVTPEQWRVLTDAIFPAAKSPEAITLALDYCRVRKLDPFKRAVHIVPMWNSVLRREVETVWPGINELQVTAARTGQWAGMDEPKWGPIKRRIFRGQIGRDNNQRNVEVTVSYPEWCSVTVYRMIGGVRHSFTEPVWWEEAYARQGRTEVPNDVWQKRVRGQLHKNAKAASLRAAFPEEMGNDYTAEEMEGKEIEHGGVVIDGEAVVNESTHEPAPAQQEQRRTKRPTNAQWLDQTEARLKEADDADAVDKIVAETETQNMLDYLRDAARDRLNKMINDAIARTRPEEFTPPTTEESGDEGQP